MADIQTLLQKIMSAIYGEEVRGSIHDAIEAMNEEVEVIKAIDVTVDHNEIVDARTDDEGTTHSSLGVALRSIGPRVTDVKNAVNTLINNKTTTITDAQNYYIEYKLTVGKIYNITNKADSGQFTMKTRTSKTGSDLETVGTFRAGETKQFVPTENAEWLVGYANSATTIYIEEDGLIINGLDSRISDIEQDINDFTESIETNESNIAYTLAEVQDFANTGFERLKGFWGFGNIAGGIIYSNVKYRALSKLQVYDRDITLTPVDSSNFSYAYSTANSDGSVTGTKTWMTDTPVTVHANQYFYVVIKRNTEDTSETINPNEFAGKVLITTKIYDMVVSGFGESEIASLNKSQEQMVYNLKKGRSSHFQDAFSPLTFVHFSDIHRSEILWKRICEYMDKYHSVIPFALHTGDYVKAYIGQYTDLYATQTPKNGYILNCVGNHDTYLNSTGTEKASAETVKGLLFNHISDWGVTFGTGSSIMYYYKDFVDSGIRLIVLDQYYWDSTEESWLQSLLDDARTNNLAVITASHTNTAPLLTENRVDCTFTSYDTTWDNGEQTITFVANLDTMIKTFKDAGGEHICHLSGHWHHDILGHTANGTLCIAIECATSDHANWCDSERITGAKSYDCFNVISADRSLHQIRLVRIGNNVDFYGREKNVLCYDYLNHEVISNS